MKSRVVPVVGMHRSGTSAVARGVKALGVELGSRLLPPNAAENPKGFWEDLDLLGIDELVLKAVGLSSWQSIRQVDPGAWASAPLEGLKAAAAALVGSKFGSHPLWGFKDPRTARLLPFWKDVFRRVGSDAGYVLVLRNPISVARSLVARNAMPAEKAHLLWLEHMVQAFLDTEGERRVVVDFDRLMSSPEAQLERIAVVLDIPLTAQVREEISAFGEHFLDGAHRHSVFGADQVESDPAVPSLARRAFRVLDRVAADAASVDDPDVLTAMRVVGEELAGLVPLCRLTDDLESAHAVCSQDLAGAKRTIGLARHEIANARRETEEMRQLRTEALEALEQTRRSLSWRVTAPLRQGHWIAGRLARAPRATAEAGAVAGDAADVVPGAGAGSGGARVEFSFPLPEAQPDVSVIVPALGPADSLLACLRSIHDARSYRSFEVIVVDDGGPGPGQEHPAVPGVLLIKTDGPPGSVRSLNRAAQAARGRFLLFVSSEAQAQPGWLDELVSAFEHNPDAGLAGSKVVGGDGRLQEAGRVLFNDGSWLGRGSGEDPDRPEYNFITEVDCCSLVSAMVPRGVFQSLGGFDEGYRSRGMALADFALALGKRSHAVLCQPLSRVVRGGEAGAGAGEVRPSAEEARRLRERWPEALARRDGPGAVAREPGRRGARRLLVIDTMTPRPNMDAGSVDAFSYLRIFRSLSFEVTFIPEGQLQHCGEYTAALQRLGVECLYEPHVASVGAHLRECGGRYDLVMLYRAPTAARHIDDVRRHCPNATVIFNTVDLHYLREERQAVVERSAELARAAAETKRMELSVIARSDCTIVLSTAEQEILAGEEGARGKRIAVMPLIIPVPGRSVPFAGRRDVVFVGGYRHRPNVDAVLSFTREIWPLVRRRVPEARFLVVGSYPSPEILELQGDGIVVAGHVDDLGALFAACRLSVAPLRYGAGMKGKVLTSMSHGVPCVASPVAVEGGEYRHGENVVVADTPEAFADAVVRVHGDEELWNRLSRNGLLFVEQGYSLDAGRARIEALLASLS